MSNIEKLTETSLKHFTGTQGYHKVSYLGPIVSDGVRHVFEHGMGWMVTDACISIAMVDEIKNHFKHDYILFVEHLTKTNTTIYHDGGGNETGKRRIIHKQEYSSSSANPGFDIKMVCSSNVLMLNSEN